MTLPNLAERKRAEEELVFERSLLRSLLDYIPDSIYFKDEENRFLRVSKSKAEHLGVERDEIIGKTDFDFYPKDQAEQMFEDDKWVMEEEEPIVGKMEKVVRPDGNERWVSVTKIPRYDEDGNVVGTLGISRDITERKRAEEEMRRRSEELTVLNNIGMAVTGTLDLQEVLQTIQKRTRELLGEKYGPVFALFNEGDQTFEVSLTHVQEQVVRRVDKLLGMKFEELPIPLSSLKPALREALSAGKPYVANDVRDFFTRGTSRRLFKGAQIAMGVKGIVALPLWAKGELIGTMLLFSQREKIPEGEIELLSGVANQAAIAIENARIFEGEQRRATQLTVINEVGRKAISILDLDEMLKEVARSIRRGFDYYNVALFLVDTERQEAVIEAVVGGFEHIVPGEYRQPLDQGIIGWVIRTGRPWLANDVSQDPYYIKGFLEEVLTKSELCVPIQLGGEVIGALDIQSIYLDAFDKTDVMAMETLSGQIAIAIQNARLYQELRRELTERQRAEEAIRRRTKELAALYDVSLDVAAQLDLDTLLKTILLRAMELLRAKAGGLYLYHLERQELELIVAQGLSKDYTGTRLALGEGACGKVALSKEPLVVTDYINWEGRSRQFNDDPTFNVLAVPIKRGDTLLGALYVDDPDVGRRFEEGDIRLATLFANQAAIAIQNARLYEEERKRSGELSALLDTAQTLASSLDLAQLLETIASQAKELTQADGSRIYLLEPNEKTLRALVVLERYAEEIMATPVLVGQGITGHVASTGIAEIVNHAERDPRAIQIPGTPLEAQCLMCAPLTVKGKTIGAMTLSREGEKEFEDSDLRLLTSLAIQASTAIENARLYEETKRLAATDPLTGVWNRRHIEERLRTEAARAHRFYHSLSVLVMDIDNLKLFNDTYGHAAGDKVIRTVAQAVLTSCREIDIVGRYGGDEFAVILPEADARGAAMVAERILAALEKEPFQTPEGIKVPINMSIGAASYSSDSDDADRLFSLADAAMYRVKVAGGGQFASLMVGPEEVPQELVAPFDALQGLLIAVDTKDRYTFKHSQEVTERALALARAVGLSEEEMRALEVAGKLHDVGKIGIPAKVLRKPGALTPEEWKTIQEHPRLGYLVLQQLPQMETMLEAVLHHHERWDGNGYPDGLKGKQIPKLARILAIADAYSAMLTDRPYRKALSRQEALREIQDCAGTQFDPELAELFADLPLSG